MSEQTTLSDLRKMFKARTGQSLSTSYTQKDTIFNSLLADTQSWLADEYDWSFLRDTWDASVIAGGRYVTLPTTAKIAGATKPINFRRHVHAATRWSDSWLDLDEGIGLSEWEVWDSDDAETCDPIQRWSRAGIDKFEVWPMPATAQTVRFWGQRKLAALTADGDKADLDDVLIVLFASADYLANAGLGNAPLILAAAQQHLARLRAQDRSRKETYIVGSGVGGTVVRTVPIKTIAVA